MCISRPSFAKTLLIRLSPSVASSLVSKKKAPLSMLRIWWMIRSSALFALLFRCHVSCPLLVFVTFLNVASGRPHCFHSFSSVSAKADIRKRKITDDTLSPCRTPTSWSISVFSFPIFTMTLRLVYSLLMLSQNYWGAPYCSSILSISSWLYVS